MKDADPQAVVDALTGEDPVAATGLAGLNERHGDRFSAILAAQFGQWTVFIVPGTYITESELTELSRSTQVFMHYKSIEADCRVAVWADGHALVAFDLLLRLGFTPEAIPAWKERLSKVGVDPEGGGAHGRRPFSHSGSIVCVGGHYTGCVIDSDALADATFLIVEDGVTAWRISSKCSQSTSAASSCLQV